MNIKVHDVSMNIAMLKLFSVTSTYWKLPKPVWQQACKMLRRNILKLQFIVI